VVVLRGSGGELVVGVAPGGECGGAAGAVRGGVVEVVQGIALGEYVLVEVFDGLVCGAAVAVALVFAGNCPLRVVAWHLVLLCCSLLTSPSMDHRPASCQDS